MRKLFLIAFSFAVASSGASADTVRFFSNALSTVDATPERQVDRSFSASGAFVEASAAEDLSPVGATLASSSASLSAGELKAKSQVDGFGVGDGSILFSFARAEFGDTYSVFGSNGSTPFNWSSASEVEFRLDISGAVDLAQQATNGSTLFLNIYAPEDLDTYARWIQDNSNPRPTPLFDFGYALGTGNSGSGLPFIDETITDFPNVVSAKFNPGGDFAWVLGLITFTTLNTGLQSLGSATLDFSQTIDTSYFGPEGSVTAAASGSVLDGEFVQPIPLPGGLPLLVGGLALVWGYPRLRKA